MHPTAGLPPTRPLPQPPRLHWGFVLLFDILTLGIFDPIWLIVQANWVRKVRGRSKAMPWAIAYTVIVPLFIVVIVLGIVLVLAEPATSDVANPITTLFRVAVIVLRLVSIYTLRNELEESPIHVSTGGVMTFFFGSVYFQYHLQDYVLSEEDRPSADGTLGLS